MPHDEDAQNIIRHTFCSEICQPVMVFGKDKHIAGNDDSFGVYRDKTKWTILRKAHYRYIAERLKIFRPESLLLDLGSGPRQFHDLYEKFFVTTVDFNATYRPDYVMDMELELRFADGIFDVVMSTNVFEHIYEIKNLMRECYRVIKPGGMLVGSTPFLSGTHQAPHDYWRYTSYALQKMFLEAGYIDCEIVSLAAPNEVLRQFQLHFYGKTLGFVGHKTLARLFVKVVWKIQNILDFFFRLFAKRNPATVDFTLGYGFVARKPR